MVSGSGSEGFGGFYNGLSAKRFVGFGGQG